MSRRPDIKKLEAQCASWNAYHPVGTEVILERDGGELVNTKTRSEAQILSGHSAVIFLEGVTGCYLLNRVTPARLVFANAKDETPAGAESQNTAERVTQSVACAKADTGAA